MHYIYICFFIMQKMCFLLKDIFDKTILLSQIYQDFIISHGKFYNQNRCYFVLFATKHFITETQ